MLKEGPIVTRGPFGVYAEWASVCGVKSCVIYGRVLKHNLDKLPFNVGFRTLEYDRGFFAFIRLYLFYLFVFA